MKQSIYQELPVCGGCVWCRAKVVKVGKAPKNVEGHLHMIDLECEGPKHMKIDCRAATATEDELHYQCANDRLTKKNTWQVR